MDPKHYKLIAFDLDGTLLDFNNKISAYSRKVLKELHEKGILYTFATGRLLSAVKEYADDLEIDCPLVLANGGIVQERQGALLNQTYMNRKAIDIVIETLKDENVELVFFICDQIYYQNNTNKERKMHQNRTSNYKRCKIDNWNLLENKLSQVNKCVVFNLGADENLKRLDEMLKLKLNGIARLVHSNTNMFEILPKGISKAFGLNILAAKLGIDMQQIIAFGDHNNDVEMLAEVGLGIAVGEATPDCIANADLVVASSDEDGPAHFLEEFLLNA